MTLTARRLTAFALVAISSAVAPHARGQEATAAPVAAASTPATASADFSGTWESTFGTLVLKQTDAAVTGEYRVSGRNAKIEGTVAGRRLTFTYTEHDARGEGWFDLSSNTRTFAGEWREEGAPKWSRWEGKRVLPPSFDGLWKTNHGLVRLNLTGDQCTGAYMMGGLATVEGTVNGRRLVLTYREPSGVQGDATLELADDASSFTGTWKAEVSGNGGAWKGTRVEPVKGKRWLVILEAHWEGSLQEPEFSYGEMQRAFFKRLPQVSVRHRFIHDLADVERFCAEVPFIAEPVVVYFSSHGTQQGLQVGSSVVTPEQLGRALRGGGNIALLHFGACEVLAGDGPSRLLNTLPPGVGFPISGFANPADWAGSAIIDFTYLDLILEHGLTPAAAVAETRASLRFADRKDGDTRGVISPSLLRIHEAP